MNTKTQISLFLEELQNLSLQLILHVHVACSTTIFPFDLLLIFVQQIFLNSCFHARHVTLHPVKREVTD